MDAAEKAARKAHQDELKQAAAEKALDWLTPGKVVGVGSGSTVAFFIEALGRRRKDFPQAVSSSLRSTELLREAGIEVLDLNGCPLWTHQERGVSTSGTYTVPWNLTADNGNRLETGVYLYRVSIACNGSHYVSKARKLIITSNK